MTGRAAAGRSGGTAPGRHGWVLHVDLDRFVAAVEMLRRPELVDVARSPRALPAPTTALEDVEPAALSLSERTDRSRAVRLLGVRLEMADPA